MSNPNNPNNPNFKINHKNSDDIFTQLNQNLIETTTSSEMVYNGFLKLKHDTVILPNQNPATREYIAHPGAVMIIPMIDNQTCLLEYQYRHPLKQTIIEFPAGKIDAGEQALKTAQRELLEETGYHAQIWHYLGKIAPVAAYSDEYIHLYIAQNLVFIKQQLDEDEHLQTFSYPIAKLKDAIYSGKIFDAKTIIGVYRLLDFLAKID